MKKFLTLIAALSLVASLAVGGSIAYLQDTDEAVNVMTLGNVKITQNEQQRVKDEKGNFTSSLEPYEQGKMLLPVTYLKPEADQVADIVKIGDYEVTLSDKETNYVDKIVSVTNDSNIPIYLRTLFALPTGGEDWVVDGKPVAANDCWLHWNIPSEYASYWTLNSTPVLITVNNVDYWVWEFVHKGTLAADKTTYPMVRGFYMDQHIDIDDDGMYYDTRNNKKIQNFTDANGNVNVMVLSQAVQADGFNSESEALTEAFGAFNADNKDTIQNWFGDMEPLAVVNNAEDLTAALAAGNDVMLAADVNLNENVSFEGPNTNATINLNGHTLTFNLESNSDTAFKVDQDAKLHIENGTIKSPNSFVLGVFGNGQITASNCKFEGKYGFGMNGTSTTAESSADFENCHFKVTSGYNAAYISAPGTYTFKDCTLEGGAGILIRSGNVTLDSCNIIAHGYMGEGNPQKDIYLNYNYSSGNQQNGITYWNTHYQQASTGDCVVIIDGDNGHELKSVTIKDCTFEIKNKIKVNDVEIPTAYAIRYLDVNEEDTDPITPDVSGNKDINGNEILSYNFDTMTGDITTKTGYVYFSNKVN